MVQFTVALVVVVVVLVVVLGAWSTIDTRHGLVNTLSDAGNHINIWLTWFD